MNPKEFDLAPFFLSLHRFFHRFLLSQFVRPNGNIDDIQRELLAIPRWTKWRQDREIESIFTVIPALRGWPDASRFLLEFFLALGSVFYQRPELLLIRPFTPDADQKRAFLSQFVLHLLQQQWTKYASASLDSPPSPSSSPMVEPVTIRISNLEPDVTLDDVLEIFGVRKEQVNMGEAGQVDVSFPTRAKADRFFEEFEGAEVDDRAIQIKILQPEIEQEEENESEEGDDEDEEEEEEEETESKVEKHVSEHVLEEVVPSAPLFGVPSTPEEQAPSTESTTADNSSEALTTNSIDNDNYWITTKSSDLAVASSLCVPANLSQNVSTKMKMPLQYSVPYEEDEDFEDEDGAMTSSKGRRAPRKKSSRPKTRTTKKISLQNFRIHLVNDIHYPPPIPSTVTTTSSASEKGVV